MHVHSPVALLQSPRPLHSTKACAVSSAVALSEKDVPKGHILTLQLDPCQPSWHSHSENILHVPLLLQFW